jgi:hypothetical protein
MITLNGLADQITMIITEHKDCGGHCHHYGNANNNMDLLKDNEHLSLAITYFVWGVINNGIYRDN